MDMDDKCLEDIDNSVNKDNKIEENKNKIGIKSRELAEFDDKNMEAFLNDVKIGSKGWVDCDNSCDESELESIVSCNVDVDEVVNYEEDGKDNKVKSSEVITNNFRLKENRKLCGVDMKVDVSRNEAESVVMDVGEFLNGEDVNLVCKSNVGSLVVGHDNNIFEVDKKSGTISIYDSSVHDFSKRLKVMLRKKGIDFEESLHQLLTWRQFSDFRCLPAHKPFPSLSDDRENVNFLLDPLKEEVYSCPQPEGFGVIQTSKKVNTYAGKALYGLKQLQSLRRLRGVNLQVVPHVIVDEDKLKRLWLHNNKIPLICDSQSAKASQATPCNIHKQRHPYTLTMFYESLPRSVEVSCPEGMVVRLGINPMIQPEPEDLPKDNPKLKIAVLRPSDAMQNPSQPFGFLSTETCLIVMEDNTRYLLTSFLTPRFEVFTGSYTYLDDYEYSSLAFEEEGLNHLETNIFSSKLSLWKARLLLVGGRLSLIKAVLGNLPTYFMSIYLMPVSIRSNLELMRSKFFRGADQNENKMSWVKWTKCLSSKQMGGLGIGSIYGLNIGLPFKWIWRFLIQPLALWSRVIRSIYGQSGGVFNVTNRRPKQSTWGTILSLVHRLKDKDIWFGNTPLRLQFPRIYNLDIERNCLIANRIPLLLSDWSTALRRFPRGGVEMTQFDDLKAVIGNVSLTDQRDTWQWSLDVAGGFSVGSARAFVDDTMLEADSVATRWNRTIPIKVNVFLWRLHLNKLPSRVNLDSRGVRIDFILCQTCQLYVETVNHIFFNCEMAKDLWSLLAKWWDLDIPICANISEWYDWLDVVRVAAMARSALECVGGTLFWSIWNFRNQLLFSCPPPKKATIWDFIISQSFLWFSFRNPK
ncbi:RNA-directed DNA polymerase, eukaryota, reverse transcriptase zinc-binding domain protein, partial [Tanacetum coccineum]